MIGASGTKQELLLIDDSLIRMRRLWKSHDTPSSLSQESGAGLEMSTVLVTDAVHRGMRDGEHPSVADIADRLDVTHSTASRLVDRAVTAGMIARSRADTDHRRVTLALTTDGAVLVRQSVQFRADYLQRLLADWSASDIATFAALLARFATSARNQPHPTGATT